VEVSDMRSQISAAAVAILFSLSICLVSVRSADDSKDLKAKVDKLIKQLDDNDSSKRTQAETELIKLGLDILPLLPEKDEGLSAEQKRRLASVRATLKTADAQKNIQPRLCTIQDQSIPLSKALEELTKQTEIKVEDGRQNAG